MSPTVPPTSVITTSGTGPSATGTAIARIRSLISLVMCGITWTVSPEILAAALLRRSPC